MLQAAVDREWPHTKSVLATPQSGASTISAVACSIKERETSVSKPYTYPPKQLFTVSGPRKVVEEDDEGKVVTKMLPNFIRFESVSEEQAVIFAQDVYKRENIILEMFASDIGQEV
jgi:hypothetical protein